MTDLLQQLGLDQRLQQTVEALQARVGEWLAIPSRVRAWQGRSLDPALQARIGQLAADYASTKPLVDRTLTLLQQLQAARSLPSLDQVPTIIAGAAAVLSTTDTVRQINGDLGEAMLLPDGSSKKKLVLTVGGMIAGAVLAWKLWTLARRGRRRRR